MAETFRTPGKRRRREQGEGTLYKRADGMWVGRIELEPGPNGERRRSKPVYSKDKAKVIEKLNKVREDAAKGIEQVSQRLTVEEWMTYWLDDIAVHRIGPDTLNTYRSAIKNNIVPHIGNKPLAKLRPSDVRHMHAQIQKTRSTRTAELAHNVLSRSIDDAMKESPPRVLTNVCRLVDRPSVVSESRGHLTIEQARKVLITSAEAGDLYATRWLFALLTGARQAECLGLEWDRVDFDKGLVDISWQLKRIKMKPGADPDAADRFDVRPGVEIRPVYRGLALRRTKTKKSRIIPLPESVAKILKQYRDHATPNDFGLVWVSPKGLPIEARDDDAAWYAALERAGVPRIVLHSARHTTATLLAEMGVDEQTRMQIVGHSSVAAQRGYRHVSTEQSERVMTSFADSLLAIED